jgi:hypothetical protein
MKYLKLFEAYNKQIATSKTDGDWRTTQFDSKESFDHVINNFYLDKKWLHKEGDFDVYFYEVTDWDKDENEPFWYHKSALYIDYKHYIIKEKKLEDKPLYSIRDEKNGMTHEQELELRKWVGTSKNPKRRGEFVGGYFGMEDGFALMRSPHSGTIYKIDKDGEMYNKETGEQLKGE